MTPLTTLLFVLVTIYLLAECISMLVGGTGLMLEGLRIARRIFRGTREIVLPEDLRIAAANGLLKVGSEVVVGTKCEWDGISVRRFAVSPLLIPVEAGTIMEVVRLTRYTIELKIGAGQ